MRYTTSEQIKYFSLQTTKEKRRFFAFPQNFHYLRPEMNIDVLGFVTFCVGAVARTLQMPRNDVYAMLKQSGILYDYIVPCYDVLHTFGSDYIVEDITDYIKKKGLIA